MRQLPGLHAGLSQVMYFVGVSHPDGGQDVSIHPECDSRPRPGIAGCFLARQEVVLPPQVGRRRTEAQGPHAAVSNGLGLWDRRMGLLLRDLEVSYFHHVPVGAPNGEWKSTGILRFEESRAEGLYFSSKECPV